MCGIFGFSFSDSVDTTQRCIVASILAVHMDDRGGHSWGYYAPQTNKLVKGLDKIGSSVNAKDLACHSMLMAHTRFATTGSIKPKNAHPFALRDVVGAHNGMVSNHAELNKIYQRRCKVDSLHIFHHIQDNLDLEEIEAYGAVEYVRKDRQNRVYLGRFNGGDLSIARIKDGSGFVWASTHLAVEQAIAMAGLEGDFYNVEQGCLYFIEQGSNEMWKDANNLGFSKYWPKPQMGFRPLIGSGSDDKEFLNKDDNDWDDKDRAWYEKWCDETSISDRDDYPVT